MGDLKFPAGFKESEFACRCGCGGNSMDQAFLNRLGMLRTSYGMPMVITSAYRCKAYNDLPKVGGKKNSQHLVGRAVDVAVAESDKRYKLVACALSLGFKGVGLDGCFVHLDTREVGQVLFLYEQAKGA